MEDIKEQAPSVLAEDKKAVEEMKVLLRHRALGAEVMDRIGATADDFVKAHPDVSQKELIVAFANGAQEYVRDTLLIVFDTALTGCEVKLNPKFNVDIETVPPAGNYL